jgi:hypothetical protein
MEDTHLQIELDKKLYEPGEFVTGAVRLKTRIPLNLTKLILVLSKERIIDVCNLRVDTVKSGERCRDESNIYEHKFNLFENLDVGQDLSCGSHVFPFRFSLRASDNSSTDIRGIYFDYLVNIKNSYKLTCNMFLSGTHEPLFDVNKEIQVIDRIEKDTEFKINVELSSILCLFYKSYTIYFKLNRSLFFAGDQLILDIDFQRMKKHVKEIECNVYEILSVSSRNINFIRTRYIIGGVAQQKGKEYTVELRIPSTSASSVSENEFNLKTVMFLTIYMHKSSPIKIKKYIQVVKKPFEIPQIDYLDVLDGEIFEEKIFIVS